MNKNLRIYDQPGSPQLPAMWLLFLSQLCFFIRKLDILLGLFRGLNEIVWLCFVKYLVNTDNNIVSYREGSSAFVTHNSSHSHAVRISQKL